MLDEPYRVTESRNILENYVHASDRDKKNIIGGLALLLTLLDHKTANSIRLDILHLLKV